jgi:glucose-1-phosphate cytidylyltransferase
MGTRLAEHTDVRPKPMVEVGGRPLLWHLMKHFASFGFHEFVIGLGYKGEYIKKYMVDYSALNGNLRIGMRDGHVAVEGARRPDWTVDLVDTGMETLTGGRIKRLAPFLGGETFMLTWGDGVSNVDLKRLLAFHREHGKLATVTTVRPPARYGRMRMEGNKVVEFAEKPQMEEGWINGAFFVLEPEVLEYIEGDNTMFEHAPLERLASDGQLMAYKHDGFWQCMDTLREKQILEDLWSSGSAPWKTWE